jgi:hypothetical protein
VGDRHFGDGDGCGRCGADLLDGVWAYGRVGDTFVRCVQYAKATFVGKDTTDAGTYAPAHESLSSRAFVTQVLGTTLEPVWKHSFVYEFEVPGADECAVCFDVWDRRGRTSGEGDFMGQVVVRLDAEELVNGTPYEAWFQLVGRPAFKDNHVVRIQTYAHAYICTHTHMHTYTALHACMLIDATLLPLFSLHSPPPLPVYCTDEHEQGGQIHLMVVYQSSAWLAAAVQNQRRAAVKLWEDGCNFVKYTPAQGAKSEQFVFFKEGKEKNRLYWCTPPKKKLVTNPDAHTTDTARSVPMY